MAIYFPIFSRIFRRVIKAANPLSSSLRGGGHNHGRPLWRFIYFQTIIGVRSNLLNGSVSRKKPGASVNRDSRPIRKGLKEVQLKVILIVKLGCRLECDLPARPGKILLCFDEGSDNPGIFVPVLVC